jgi:hypothetical protein
LAALRKPWFAPRSRKDANPAPFCCKTVLHNLVCSQHVCAITANRRVGVLSLSEADLLPCWCRRRNSYLGFLFHCSPNPNYLARIVAFHQPKPDYRHAASEFESLELAAENAGILAGMRFHAAAEAAFKIYVPTAGVSPCSCHGALQGGICPCPPMGREIPAPFERYAWLRAIPQWFSK